MNSHHVAIVLADTVADRDGEVAEPGYDDIPNHRKRWVLTLLFLFLVPAMIAITLTGPVYQNDGGRALAWEDRQRYQAAIGGAIFLLLGVVRLLVPSAA